MSVFISLFTFFSGLIVSEPTASIPAITTHNTSDNTDFYRQTCNRGPGPWYIYDYEGRQGLSLLNRNGISFLNKKGTVLFCEGDSFFSGLVTTNEINFVGFGDRERIRVKPVENQYFNILSLRLESLNQLFSVLEITQDDLTLTGLHIDDYPEGLISPESEKRLNISIENITFTQDYIDPEKFTDDYSRLNGLTPEFEDNPVFDFRLEEKAFKDDNYDGLDINEGLSGHDPAAIQINRMGTDLRMNGVIFSNHSFNRQIVRLHTNLDLIMNDVEFSDNKNNLLLASKYIKNSQIQNIKIHNNTSAGFSFFNTSDPFPGNSEIKLLGGVISKNESIRLLIMGMSTYINEISFEKNGFGRWDPDSPGLSNYIEVIANRYDDVKIHNSNFNENKNFYITLANGWGSITESIFIKNHSTGGMLRFSGLGHKLDNTRFERNNIQSVMGLILVNSEVTLSDSYVAHSYYNYERTESRVPFFIFSLIGKESVNYATFDRYVSDPVQTSEINRMISFKNTFFEHSMRSVRDEATIIGFYDLESDSPIVEFKRFEEGLNTLDCYWDGRTLCR